MSNKYFLSALLVASLCVGASSAIAAVTPGPTAYHVEIDTTGMSGDGFLDLSFIAGQLPATYASAVLSDFSGVYGAASQATGDVAGALSNGLTFGNTHSYNDFLQSITLGGKFGFDIGVGGAFLTSPGTSNTIFAFDLLSADYTNLGNPSGNLGEIVLTPVTEGSAAGISTGVYDPALATITPISAVAPVPEPSAWLTLLSGLGVMGLVIRRRASTRIG